MATNPYINFTSVVSEQNLLENLTIESIKTAGIDINYLPRTILNSDSVFKEGSRNSYSSVFTIEVYLPEAINPIGLEREVITQFGLQINDNIELVVAKGRFESVVSSRTKPYEGDLIYIPLLKKLFEIKFVETEDPFKQLGTNYSYKLACEMYQYVDDEFSTGITAIDNIEQDYSYTLELTMNSGGSGTFTIPIDNIMNLTATPTSTLSGLITGGTSSATAYIAAKITDTSYNINSITGTFTSGENISDVHSTPATLSGAVTLETPGEIVYQGTDLASATAKAEVLSWNSSTYVLIVNNIINKFIPNAAIIGNSSSSNWTMAAFISGTQNDPLEMIEDEFADNIELEIAGDEVLDFTESNPFGEVGNRSQ